MEEETGGRLNSVRASTDKRQTPSLSSSFVCFKRHLFGGLARGFSKLGEETRDEREVAVVAGLRGMKRGLEAHSGRRRAREIWGCMVRRGRI